VETIVSVPAGYEYGGEIRLVLAQRGTASRTSGDKRIN
jgi:hypothetical protein